jgi:hypothetical protein
MNRFSRRAGVFIVLVTAFTLFLLWGCNSLSPVANAPVIVHNVADLTITLLPLSRDTLVKRHMDNKKRYMNPYIDYPGQIPRRRIIVFETRFQTTESTLLVNVFEQNLTIGTESGRAQTALYMMRLWETYLDDVAKNKVERTLKDTVFPEDFTVEPGEPITGYLVFAAPYPKGGGEGMLTLKVSTSSGDRGTFEIPVNFAGTEGTESETGENTGVFGE